MGSMNSAFSAPLSSMVQGMTMNVSGPFGATQVITGLLTRVGNAVFFELPAVLVTGGNAVASATSQAGLIPAGLRPQATIYQPISVISNSVILPAAGKLEITTAGNVNIYLDLLGTGLWSVLGTAGWQRSCLSYITA